MKLSVDLNADLGEGSGHDAGLFDLISSANIATGFQRRRFRYDARAIFRGEEAASSCRSASEFFSIARISDANR